MCIQVTERYAICGCLYYLHAIDPCPRNGKKGHQIQKKSISVGYTCPSHTPKKPVGISDGHNDLVESLPYTILSDNLSTESLRAQSSEEDERELDTQVRKLETPLYEQQYLGQETNQLYQKDRTATFNNKTYLLPSLLFSAILASVNLFALTNSLQIWLQISGIHLLNFLGIGYFSWFLTLQMSFDLGWKPKLKGYAQWLLRPGLQKGWTRIEWTCSCGDLLFGDFLEKTPGSLSKLAKTLGGRIIAGHSSGGEVSDCIEGFGREECSGKLQITQSQTNLIKASASGRNLPFQQQNEAVMPRIAVDSHTVVHRETKRKRWLELCIRSGRNTFNLGEVDLVGVQDDQTVFAKIKEKYMQNRQAWFGSWLLRVPSGGIFVELRKDKLVSKDQVPTASIMKRNSIPTPQEAVLYKYVFCPVPMDEPPIDSRTFYHYFSKPHAAEDISVWTTRFPKLDDSSLYYSTERLAKGWGIEITEELNWPLFLAVSLVILLLSGLAAGVSSYLMNDRSTGVAIGAWLSAVQALATTALFFHWSRS